MMMASLVSSSGIISVSSSFSSSSSKSHQPTQSQRQRLSRPQVASSSERCNAGKTTASLINRRNLLIGTSAALHLLIPSSSSAARQPTSDMGDQFPRALDSAIQTRVRRPKKSRSKAEKEAEEEVLVIAPIQLPREAAVKFDVYINVKDALVLVPKDSTEFVGSFVSVPQGRLRATNPTRLSTCLRLGISDCIDDLGADADDDVEVTLVPRLGTDAVTIGGIKIELLS